MRQIVESPNYFVMFRVHKASTEREIAQSRRELMMYVHPDLNARKEAHQLAAMVNAAYETLTTEPEKYARALGRSDCAACKGRGFATKQRGFKNVTTAPCTVCGGTGRSK